MIFHRSVEQYAGCPIALKTLRPELLDNSSACEFSARLRLECEAARHLLHFRNKRFSTSVTGTLAGAEVLHRLIDEEGRHLVCKRDVGKGLHEEELSLRVDLKKDGLIVFD